MGQRMTAKRMPAEWAPQSMVLIAWPHPDGDFGPWFDKVEHCYGLIATLISQYQPLLILFKERSQRDFITQRLQKQRAIETNVQYLQADYDDIWVRDTAPLAVIEHGRAILVDFQFNGWGNKYPCAKDKRLGETLYRAGIFGDIPYHPVHWVLEGGSIETDGQGTLLATRKSVLNPNRNGDPQSAEILLNRYLGFKRFLWLDHGHLQGDDTDAHIDTLARFCRPDTIAYTACDDPADSHYADLQAMARQLAAFKTPAGEPFQLFPLPIPKPVYTDEGRRLPATYANFLIINGAVLVPVYNDPADEFALAQLTKCFPDRKIIPIPANPLILQYGSLHCMSMQYPAPVQCEVK